MEIEKAIKILHPDTTFKAITEIEYYGGFKGKEKAMEAINEACVVACECMEKQIEKKVIIRGLGQRYCPTCRIGGANDLYCGKCGQKLSI